MAYVERILAEAEDDEVRVVMSAINIGEVYSFLRKQNREALAESWRESSGTLPVTIKVPAISGKLPS